MSQKRQEINETVFAKAVKGFSGWQYKNTAWEFLDSIHITKKQYDTKERAAEKCLHFKVTKAGMNATL